ncbi:hypothetical protein ACFY2W_34120 [Streptomyces sp. NPDC001262]|uniref:hypothetical protein n=1 Tax=Streptomyces sp. NPDC001262 TaxID=3364552 RepID=UPI00368A52AA
MNHTTKRPTAPTLPELRLDLEALDHNIGLMADWSRAQGAELCPHIKTTMTRPIVERQMNAGAWGVTVATVRQVGIALGWGLRRILIANQVIDPRDLTLLRQWLDEDPGLEIYCCADSMTGLLLAQLAMRDAPNPLRLLIDVGAEQGLTGLRGPSQAHALGTATVCGPQGILLAGVVGYEGTQPDSRDATTLEAVDAHCRNTVETFRRLRPLFQSDRPLLSLGDAAFPDRVVQSLADLDSPTEVLPVLRSGCYVTHDHGNYRNVSPLPGLKPALTVRATVLSAPEPGCIIVGAGKRELPHGAGLPVLLAAWNRNGKPCAAAEATATRIYDHHLVLTEARDLTVGDEVDLGISHPCSAFERWPSISVVGSQGCRQDVWHPEFH